MKLLPKLFLPPIIACSAIAFSAISAPAQDYVAPPDYVALPDYVAPPADPPAPSPPATPATPPTPAQPESTRVAETPPSTETPPVAEAPAAPKTASLGTATADFDNLRPDKNETPWGRLVADALLEAGKADIAVVNASTLHRGVLKAGPVEPASIDALLSFGDDELVTISITGDQLRAALERAAQSYPTASPAFLHCAGFLAQFNAQAPINRRVTLVRFKGREVENTDTLTVAMPISLAEGAAGYFTIWNSQGAAHSNFTVRDAVIDFIKSRKEVTPVAEPRFSAQ